MLQRQPDSLDRSIKLLAPYARVFTNTLGNGRWFDTYVQNVVAAPVTPRNRRVAMSASKSPARAACCAVWRWSPRWRSRVSRRRLWPRSPAVTVTAYFSRTVGIYPGFGREGARRPDREVKKITPEGGRVRVELSYDAARKVPADARPRSSTPPSSATVTSSCCRSTGPAR